MPTRRLASLVALSAAIAFASLAARAEPPLEQPEPKLPKEPAVQKTVIDEKTAHIEELRVRGQVQKVTVDPKGGLPRYEIIPADGARDMAPAANTSRGAAGQRVWNVFKF